MPISQEIRVRQTLVDRTPERVWTEGVVRHANDLHQSRRALAVLLRRAEEGELTILQDESPRTEELRDAHLRVGVWTVLLVLATWLIVTLRDAVLVVPLTWWMLGIVAIALCVWRLTVRLPRAGCDDTKGSGPEPT